MKRRTSYLFILKIGIYVHPDHTTTSVLYQNNEYFIFKKVWFYRSTWAVSVRQYLNWNCSHVKFTNLLYTPIRQDASIIPSYVLCTSSVLIRLNLCAQQIDKKTAYIAILSNFTLDWIYLLFFVGKVSCSNKFECDKSHCIAIIYKCDGVPDCKSKIDESPEICGTIICLFFTLVLKRSSRWTPLSPPNLFRIDSLNIITFNY